MQALLPEGTHPLSKCEPERECEKQPSLVLKLNLALSLKWKHQSDRIVDNRFAGTSRSSVCPHVGIWGTSPLPDVLVTALLPFLFVFHGRAPTHPFQPAPWAAPWPVTLSAELSKLSDLLLIK